MRAPLAVLLVASFLAPPALADHPQTFGSKTAAFDHKGGNAWWVEVRLTGSSVSKVEAQDTGDASWHALTLKSYGNWAGSFHIEPGHQVRFRATFSDGTRGTSCWFTHPAGAEQCPTGAFDATFSGVKGNEWWEEAKVSATGGTLAGVDARVDGGSWRPLSYKSWGAWAGSYHASDSSVVQFRARSTAGAEDLSGCYRWTAATATTCSDANAWPKEGSYVKYFSRSGSSFPNFWETTQVNLTFRYTRSHWEVACEGFTREVVVDHSDVTVRHDVKAAFEPPRVWEHDGLVRAYELGLCHRHSGEDFRPENVTTGSRTYSKNGAPVVVDAKIASYDDGCCSEQGAVWHPETGLVLEANFAGLHSGSRTRLVDTDAPIAATDPAPTPPAPAWPKGGSFAKYRATFEGETAWTFENTTWSYAAGRWTRTCVQHTVPKAGSTGEESTRTFVQEDAVLPRGPTAGVAIGDRVVVPPGGCGDVSDITVLRYEVSESTVRNGGPVTTTAWQSDEDPDGVGDDDAWWDTDTGLALRWEYDLSDDPSEGFYKGRLVDTDALL